MGERAVPVLPGDDVTVAKRFYVDGLGFRVRFEASEDGKEGLVGFERGGLCVTVDCPMPGHGRDACVSFEVDDADAYYEEWRERVEVLRPPKDEEWGARTFDLLDPFGNTVFVMGPVRGGAVSRDFPAGVPEVPVSDVDTAAAYYEEKLGFSIQWGDDSGGGIGGLWRGDCRLFLTNRTFRAGRRNEPPVVVWVNLGGKKEVDDLHDEWSRSGARISAPPESKPWKLHEFTATDLDGNHIRVFYDFRNDE